MPLISIPSTFEKSAQTDFNLEEIKEDAETKMYYYPINGLQDGQEEPDINDIIFLNKFIAIIE